MDAVLHREIAQDPHQVAGPVQASEQDPVLGALKDGIGRIAADQLEHIAGKHQGRGAAEEAVLEHDEPLLLRAWHPCPSDDAVPIDELVAGHARSNGSERRLPGELVGIPSIIRVEEGQNLAG